MLVLLNERKDLVAHRNSSDLGSIYPRHVPERCEYYNGGK